MAKETILIVDDSEMNRAILAEMLGENYSILEAEDGVQAVMILRQKHSEIDLVLLDIVMPEMDGYSVLEVMNQQQWIEEIPVVMVSASQEPDSIERAYDLGATDFITRPFDVNVVRRRVLNTLLLYAKQKQLVSMVEAQLYEKEQNNSVMVDILSHIVEFRNGESGLHVLHVRAITDFLLRKLKRQSDAYDLTEEQITLISTASALHDIGKIGIDEVVLNKPSKLTEGEFETMKTHAMIGAKMLDGMSLHQNNPMVKTAYEICRWHHERYDGCGYPDGLKGDEIPLSAQVVALADVYDALTSARVYKAPYRHATAVQMIMNGECGAFNPVLLECLKDSADELQFILSDDAAEALSREEIKSFADATFNGRGTASERMLHLLDYERMKNNFFSAMTDEIRFEYTISSHILTLSTWGAKKLGVNEIIMDPYNDMRIQEVIGGINWRDITTRILNYTSPEQPEISFECKIDCGGQRRWHRVVIRAVWSADEPRRCEGALGKAVDIHDAYMEREEQLDRDARDRLTGLLNHTNAKHMIQERLQEAPNQDYAMAIFDLDNFQAVNDSFGSKYGDEILQQIAFALHRGMRNKDISTRLDGDAFMLFLECGHDREARATRRIFGLLREAFRDTMISISMGVARSADVGAGYDEMYAAAERALGRAKIMGGGRVCFYGEPVEDDTAATETVKEETTT